MTRPCLPHHPDPAASAAWCKVCWLAIHHPDYRALFGETAAPPPAPVPVPAGSTPPPACVYLGDELTGPEREAAGLDHVRKWSLCLHPQQPLGPNVCGCKGCGPSCRSFTPDRQPAAG
jgi:hypothetical protein